MADTDFSNLAATSTLAAADQLLVVRGGVAYRFVGLLPAVTATGQINLFNSTGERFGLYTDGVTRIGFGVNMGGLEGNSAFTHVGFNWGKWDGTTWTPYMYLGGGTLRPGADAGWALGTPGFRWTTVYAVTGQISTSDEREKHWRGVLTEAHLRAARRIVREIGVFQWNDAIAEKGEDGARLHIGPRAQTVARIMVEEGLEAPFDDGAEPHFRHAFLCYDRWPAEPEVAEVRGEDDEVITAARAARPAGDRFGLRVDQLTMFLLAALLGGGDEA